MSHLFVDVEKTKSRVDKAVQQGTEWLTGLACLAAPFHFLRYVDEQAFRFNNRLDMNRSDRFGLALRQLLEGV